MFINFIFMKKKTSPGGIVQLQPKSNHSFTSYHVGTYNPALEDAILATVGSLYFN